MNQFGDDRLAVAFVMNQFGDDRLAVEVGWCGL
jgi:hypothetical protein